MGNITRDGGDNSVAMTEIERVLVMGDLGRLTPEQRVTYYNRTCESLGLNPLTRPFDYVNLNGKLRLYALKECTEQLRTLKAVSVAIMSREVVEGCYVVTARATMPSGRHDESIGAVAIDGLKGEARANACMKAETKAKRRVTLSICGLGFLDETEVDSIPAAQVMPAPEAHAPQLSQGTFPHTADGEVVEKVNPVFDAYAKAFREAADAAAIKAIGTKVAEEARRGNLGPTERAMLVDIKNERKRALAEAPPKADASLDDAGASGWGMGEDPERAAIQGEP